jgi:uncharacterized protein (DUF1697 family)
MRYVALLRGINVGGASMIKMDELKAVFAELGFENVVSYINSGNLAFDSSTASEAKLIDQIEGAVESRFGRRVHVMVRKQKDIVRIIKANPFERQYETHKHMHVLFLKEPMPGDKAEALAAAAKAGERYHVTGREIYCHTTIGVADSLVGKGFFEKKPAVPMTARNWRTVEKLASL